MIQTTTKVIKSFLAPLKSNSLHCSRRECSCVFSMKYYNQCVYLLHVSQHILPGVKHSFAFFRVQLVDKVCGVVLIAVLIPTHKHRWSEIKAVKHQPLSPCYCDIRAAVQNVQELTSTLNLFTPQTA